MVASIKANTMNVDKLLVFYGDRLATAKYPAPHEAIGGVVFRFYFVSADLTDIERHENCSLLRWRA